MKPRLMMPAVIIRIPSRQRNSIKRPFMSTNRRSFLKHVSAAGALVAAGGLLPVSAAVPKRNLKKAIMYATIGYKGTVLEQFKALKEAGFEGVEPMSHMNVDEVVKALDTTGLKAASVCDAVHWKKPLSHPDPAVRQEGLAALKQSLREARRYGATSVLLVPLVVNEKLNREECVQRSVAEIKKALPVAEETGVKIAIENVWKNFIIKPEEAVDFLDAIGSPLVGWHFDIGNVIASGLPMPETWIPVLGRRILKIHIKEASKAKGSKVQLFEGENDWPAIMKALDAVGYEGWAITEMPSEQTKDTEALQAFSQRLDRVLAS
jgi:L-ribulose-5-phosphate 3-epimerase